MFANRMPRGIAGSGVVPSDLGPFDDKFPGTTLNSAWTLRQISAGEAIVSGNKVSLTLTDQKDYIYKIPATMPNTPFRLVAHFKNLSSANGMVGFALLNNSFSGCGYSPYDGNSYTWNITDGAYVGTGTSVTQPSNLNDFWLELYWTGTQVKGRCANDSNYTFSTVSWGSYTSLLSPTVSTGLTNFGILKAYVNGTHTVDVVEFRVLAG